MSLVTAGAHDIFHDHAPFDPAQNFEEFLKTVPARWVVYLMSDEDERPVQLLCVKNLRASLKRRLGGDEQVGPTRRVNYREIVRHIHWRRVDSAFEADAIYLEAARAQFPQTYQGMTGFRPAWFVHVNPDADFPRYTKTTDLSIRTGVLIGPLEDKHAAQDLVENVVDWFDLCRYYNILVEAPHARACAYKEMGKCPAPCDGTISMDHYRLMIQTSAKALIDPADLIRDHTRRMHAAAKELRFESAAKIKTYIDSLSKLGKGSLRHARRLSDFQFLAFQRGPREGTAKVFLITPGQIEELAGLIHEPLKPAEILRLALETATLHPASNVDKAGAERIGVVTHHLFLAKATHGVFLHLDSIDEKSIAKAYRDLLKQKPQESVEEAEGVIKELQAL